MRTVTEVAIHRDGDNPVFGESAISVRLDDEAGGPFLAVSQDGITLRFDYDELVEICDAAKWLLEQKGVSDCAE